MSSYLLVAGVVFIPVLYSVGIAGRKDGLRLGLLIFGVGVGFLCILWQINELLPFIGAGDDEDYYRASKRSFRDLSDWFDLTQFRATHEQGGYPLLLSWVHQWAGDSLFHRKALNVCFFLMLAVVWFEIGRIIGGKPLGFISAVGVIVATPLWFYWLFLFKDMAITFLQSLFILGLIQTMTQKGVTRGYSLVGVSTILTLPFRSKLALVNLVALAGGNLVTAERRRSLVTTFMKVVLTAGLALLILILGTNPKLLQKLGVAGEHRTLDSESVRAEIEQRERSRSAQFTNVLMFPLLYLVGEVAAFNPRSWERSDASLIRSICMVPWIYIGVPLFLKGVWLILRPRGKLVVQGVAHTERSAEQSARATAERAPLLLLLMFVLIYAGVAWASADTTRWRMPALPPMVAISGFAWMSLNTPRRLSLLLGWGLCLSISLITYYAVLR